MLIILILAYCIIACISSLQVASFFIGYFGADYGLGFGNEFWNTGNFWAWILMLIVISSSCFLVKLAAVIVNNIVRIFVTALNNAFGVFLAWALIFTWIIGSIVGGIALFNWFASFPEITDWFVQGNWFAGGLLIIGVWGLVARLDLDGE